MVIKAFLIVMVTAFNGDGGSSTIVYERQFRSADTCAEAARMFEASETIRSKHGERVGYIHIQAECVQ